MSDPTADEALIDDPSSFLAASAADRLRRLAEAAFDTASFFEPLLDLLTAPPARYSRPIRVVADDLKVGDRVWPGRQPHSTPPADEPWTITARGVDFTITSPEVAEGPAFRATRSFDASGTHGITWAQIQLEEA